MNITFIRRNWSATGGAENYLQRLAAALRPLGHHCHLVCERWREDDHSFDQVTALGHRGPAPLRPKAFADSVNLHLHQNPGTFVFSLERGIRSDIYRAGDGVHREWLRRRAIHGGWWARLQSAANPKHIVQLDLERTTFHPENSRAIIANSALVKANILGHFDFPESRIHIITNGVDFDRFSSGDRARGRSALGWAENEKIVLLVGAGAERKGHLPARLVENRLRPRARLVIIDEPPPCSMPDLYAAADIFLFPTLYDPFANVTLEAMAAGLPVITTNDNGAAQIIVSGKNGFLVPDAREIGEMAAYCLACTDPELAGKIGDAARATARQHPLTSHVAATLRLIQEIADTA